MCCKGQKTFEIVINPDQISKVQNYSCEIYGTQQINTFSILA